MKRIITSLIIYTSIFLHSACIAQETKNLTVPQLLDIAFKVAEENNDSLTEVLSMRLMQDTLTSDNSVTVYFDTIFHGYHIIISKDGKHVSYHRG